MGGKSLDRVLFLWLGLMAVLLGSCGTPEKPPPTVAPTQISMPFGEIIADDVPVRSGPGKEHDVVGMLGREDTVKILGIEGEWCQVQSERFDGNVWIYERFVEEVRVLSSTSTPTPTPPLPPTPTVPPPLTATRIPIIIPCLPHAVFVKDVTVPDGTSFAPGENFTKTWQMLSNGCVPWPAGSTWVFVAGDQLGAPASVSVPDTPLGSTADLSVEMVAPEADGTYLGYWQMQSPTGERFPDRIYVLIVVSSPTPTLPVAPTPIPRPLPTPTDTRLPPPPELSPPPTPTPLPLPLPTLTNTPVPPTLTLSPTPRATVTLPQVYQSPALLKPHDNKVFGFDQQQIVNLVWFLGEPLADDHWYEVQLWREGEEPTGRYWAKENWWDMGQEYYPGDYYWRVIVVQGREDSVVGAVSPPSEARFFRWIPVAPTPTLPPPPTPGLTPTPPKS